MDREIDSRGFLSDPKDRWVRQMDTELHLILAFYWGAGRVPKRMFTIDGLLVRGGKRNTKFHFTYQQK